MLLAQVDTGSVIVAVGLIALIGTLMVVAMVKWTIDDVLKLWAGLGTVVGLITGSFGTYFFQNQTVQLQAKQHEATVAALEQGQRAILADKAQLVDEKKDLDKQLAVLRIKADALQTRAIPPFAVAKPEDFSKWIMGLDGEKGKDKEAAGSSANDAPPN